MGTIGIQSSSITFFFSDASILTQIQQMRKLAGKSSAVVFTSLPPSTVHSLTASLSDSSDDLAEFSVHSERILDLVKGKTTIDEICLLDPKAEKELSPEDGDGRFKCFLFGVGFTSFCVELG